MKRPASTASSTRTKTESAGVSQKRPAMAMEADLLDAPRCKPISEMTVEDFIAWKIPDGQGFKILQGCKSPRKGYMFEHIDFNTFAEHDTKIPEDAMIHSMPDQDWLSKNFWDPAKRRLRPDPSALPENASGAAYGIVDNGGMPFVCYVRDDAASVFRKPKDSYVLEEDWPDQFEQQRLLYIEEVVTFTNAVKIWVGIDEECEEHGNSILVHVPSSSKGKLVTALISLETTVLQVTCVDLAGVAVTSVQFDQEDNIAALVKEVKDCLQCSYVKCFGNSGEEVLPDQPLKEFTRLTLKDVTQSYVCIGPDIQSFDTSEVVTAYYSTMGNSSVPYPVALTPNTAIMMFEIPMVEVPRRELAPFITDDDGNEDWGNAYQAYYDEACTETPVSNLKTLFPRENNV